MSGLAHLLDSKLDNFLNNKVIPAIKTLIDPLIAPITKENRELKMELAELRRELKDAMMDQEEEFERRRAESDDEARKANIVFHGLDRTTTDSALSAATMYINCLLYTSPSPRD